VFCACEMTQLFSVVFCVVSVVQRLTLSLVKGRSNKWYQCKEGLVLIMFPCTFIASVNVAQQRGAGQLLGLQENVTH
jgi:hypothetical protein